MTTTQTIDTTKFQVGRTYYTASACDHNCIFAITVVSRTAKTLKTDDGRTLRIKDYQGELEHVWPMGRYSMAPQISSDDINCPKTDDCEA